MAADGKAAAGASALGLDFSLTRTTRARSVEEAAALRDVAVDAMVKTIVVRRSEGAYVFVLVPGSRSIDWAKLRAVLGERRLSLPDADEAHDATGYVRGTITPLGSTSPWPTVVDEALLAHEQISLGAGEHGLSMAVAPAALVAALDAEVADVTKPA